MHYRRTIVGSRDKCNDLVPSGYPVTIDKELKFKDHSIIEGSFLSPFNQFCDDLIPTEVKTAK